MIHGNADKADKKVMTFRRRSLSCSFSVSAQPLNPPTSRV